jgi:putative ABC transport system permease protein
MRIYEMILYSMNSMRQRNVRSWLTVLGIIVGITSVIVLVGLVHGLKDDLKRQLESFGPRTIIVFPVNIEQTGFAGSSSFSPTSGKLYEKDYEQLRKVQEIEVISKVIIGRTTLVYKNTSVDASVYAVEADAFKKTVSTIEVEEGRFLFSSDQNAVVVGNDFAKDTFDKKLELGSHLIIGDNTYRLVGVLKKTGNTVAQVDNVVYLPFDKGRVLFNDSMVENEISAIRIQIKDGADMDETSEQIESIMLSSHRTTEDKKDFSLITPKFISQQVDNITSALTLFFGAVAGVSLIVGAIGIANTMFMSVMERKREIGILKSLGAGENKIMQLFLVESSLIGVAGGAIGLFLGVTIIQLIRLIANLPAVVYPEIAISAVLFSGFIGIIAGTVPAHRAAKLEPVEALRG